MKRRNEHYTPQPLPELTPEQKEFWHGQAAYWGEKQESINTALEYATARRNDALIALGMLSVNSTMEVQAQESTEQ